jgi:hypothetical protein
VRCSRAPLARLDGILLAVEVLGTQLVVFVLLQEAIAAALTPAERRRHALVNALCVLQRAMLAPNGASGAHG